MTTTPPPAVPQDEAAALDAIRAQLTTITEALEKTAAALRALDDRQRLRLELADTEALVERQAGYLTAATRAAGAQTWVELAATIRRLRGRRGGDRA
ncbi:hypothetical protein [Streptomyces carpaticus]|uniref:hypothetical protein n=1 Tax=Streptomyces carpaticus TaxID=285558 RepID=UPI0031F7D7E0